jgi:phage baseplate assembly protein W
MSTDAQVPHFAYPFRFERHGISTVEQDSLDDLAQCVQVIIQTRIGERVEIPDFGVDPIVFNDDIDRDALQRALEDWEPRIITDVEMWDDIADEAMRWIRTSVSPGGLSE